MNNMSPALAAGGNSLADEITTIFVVGFPEDMQEREFTNMFTFSCGFEGATLKIPASNEDDFGKKQIIGFAKFRTRSEALEAKDLLSGKKIDYEKGSVLKAEMAKKNLHTKRLNGNGESHQKAEITPPAGLGFTTGMNSSNGNGNHGNQVAGSNTYPRRRSHLDAPIIDSVFSTGSTGPAPGLNGYDFSSNTLTKERSASGSDLGSLYSETLGSLPSRPSLLKETSFLERSNSGFMELFDSPTSTLSRGSSTTLVDSIDSLFINEKGPPPNSVERANSVPGDRGFSSALFSSESLLSRRVFSSIPLESSGTPGTSNNNSMDFFPPLNSTSLLNGSSSLGSSLSSFGNESSNESSGNGSTLSTTVANNSGVLLNIDMSDPNASLARLGISGGDQNPPCNTLYVGNLPMDASEEELRAMFSSCTGYKRLCFKNKSNGPMCFVEFEDVQFATQALFQLYGNPLSNSTKGGIRLSYSKNPLGVRPNSNNSNSSHHQTTSSIPSGNQRSDYSFGDTLIHGH